MYRAAIALGSNLDDRKKYLDDAARLLGTIGEVEAISSWIETEPVGITDQPMFLNGAAILQTDLAPGDLMAALLNIEQMLGRDRETGVAKGPRVIDLDLLLYEERVVDDPNLKVPHPEMAHRRFVLTPLAEIAPDWVDPQSGLTVSELLEQLDTLAPEAVAQSA